MTRHDHPVDPYAPEPDTVGWCGRCGTWQRHAAALWLPNWWGPGEQAWGCVCGDGAIWGIQLRPVTPDSDAALSPAWCPCAPLHADRQCSTVHPRCPDGQTPT